MCIRDRNATVARRGRNSGAGNATRGIFNDDDNDVLDYITIASTGNAVDFGDVTIGDGSAGCSSSTRALWGKDTIVYVTISTLGNGADFGDSTLNRTFVAAFSNSVRGVWGGGRTPTIVNTIDYVTIATLGNAIDFGDLNSVKDQSSGASSPTRGCFMAGENPTNTAINSIDYITIMSTGNSIDFGDTVGASRVNAACSNGHGGL